MGGIRHRVMNRTFECAERIKNDWLHKWSNVSDDYRIYEFVKGPLSNPKILVPEPHMSYESHCAEPRSCNCVKDNTGSRGCYQKPGIPDPWEEYLFLKPRIENENYRKHDFDIVNSINKTYPLYFGQGIPDPWKKHVRDEPSSSKQSLNDLKKDLKGFLGNIRFGPGCDIYDTEKVSCPNCQRDLLIICVNGEKEAVEHEEEELEEECCCSAPEMKNVYVATEEPAPKTSLRDSGCDYGKSCDGQVHNITEQQVHTEEEKRKLYSQPNILDEVVFRTERSRRDTPHPNLLKFSRSIRPENEENVPSPVHSKPSPHEPTQGHQTCTCQNKPQNQNPSFPVQVNLHCPFPNPVCNHHLSSPVQHNQPCLCQSHSRQQPQLPSQLNFPCSIQNLWNHFQPSIAQRNLPCECQNSPRNKSAPVGSCHDNIIPFLVPQLSSRQILPYWLNLPGPCSCAPQQIIGFEAKSDFRHHGFELRLVCPVCEKEKKKSKKRRKTIVMKNDSDSDEALKEHKPERSPPSVEISKKPLIVSFLKNKVFGQSEEDLDEDPSKQINTTRRHFSRRLIHGYKTEELTADADCAFERNVRTTDEDGRPFFKSYTSGPTNYSFLNLPKHNQDTNWNAKNLDLGSFSNENAFLNLMESVGYGNRSFEKLIFNQMHNHEKFFNEKSIQTERSKNLPNMCNRKERRLDQKFESKNIFSPCHHKKSNCSPYDLQNLIKNRKRDKYQKKRSEDSMTFTNSSEVNSRKPWEKRFQCKGSNIIKSDKSVKDST